MMLDDDDRLLSVNDAKLRRQAHLVGEVSDHVARVFRSDELLTSALLVVYQKFNDEALDAVHGEIIWSELARPDLAAGLIALDEYGEEPDLVNLPSGRTPSDIEGDHRYMLEWDSNYDAIPLYACFCREMGDMEAAPSDGAGWVAAFTRDGDGVTYEENNAPPRGWLEGVRPVDDSFGPTSFADAETDTMQSFDRLTRIYGP